MIVNVQCLFLRIPCTTSQPQTNTQSHLSRTCWPPKFSNRAWRICYRRGVKRWASQYSFEQLAKILLMDGDSKLALDYRWYLFEREMDPEHGVIPEDQLSRCLTFSSNMRHFNMNSFLKCQNTTFKILSRWIDFWIALPMRCQRVHLDKFRAACPNNVLYNLSANCDKRKRVELKDRTFLFLFLWGSCGVIMWWCH